MSNISAYFNIKRQKVRIFKIRRLIKYEIWFSLFALKIANLVKINRLVDKNDEIENVTYQVDSKTMRMEPQIAAIARDHVHCLWLTANAEELMW